MKRQRRNNNDERKKEDDINKSDRRNKRMLDEHTERVLNMGEGEVQRGEKE